ncbi:hypothetical protein AMATHDRAFT_8023 [Amanita thiersii Skay4041]|uniref:Uncharacterized protein n=1 Tax=Amanita thiersii Skay4041 TaxID=703135 RepID=A0A2A9NDF3_9AGAR|nr:hypothetical protein AMATHDRAFT_8023 [Amanita thiersii Skay4041]
MPLSLPPTINSLNPIERTRLIRSTRKLDKVLGATPLFLDSSDIFLPSPPSSSNHRTLTTKPILSTSSSASSSVTSFHSFTSESDSSPPYPIKKPKATSNITTTTTTTGGVSTTTTTALITLPLSLKHQKSRSLSKQQQQQQLSRPLVLRLRSLPAATTTTITTTNPPPVSPAPQLQPQPDLDIQYRPPSLDLTLPRVELDIYSDPPMPASPAPSPAVPFYYPPLSSSPSSSLTARGMPSSPLFDPDFDIHVERERQRRKRMAKLTRTLGENIPPELVFSCIPSSQSQSPSQGMMKKVTKKKSSTSVVSGSLAVLDALAPAYAVAVPPTSLGVEEGGQSRSRRQTNHREMECCGDLEMTTPRLSSFSSSSSLLARGKSVRRDEASSGASFNTNGKDQVKRSRSRRRRPRSMTLGVAATSFAFGFTSSTATSTEDAAPFATAAAAVAVAVEGHRQERDEVPPLPEFNVVPSHRRKEKEWSGEWNIQDSQELAKALRNLKCR